MDTLKLSFINLPQQDVTNMLSILKLPLMLIVRFVNCRPTGKFYTIVWTCVEIQWLDSQNKKDTATVSRIDPHLIDE